MAETITGGELVAQALIERKVDTIFSLCGGHITPIYQYLEGSEVKIFDTRHEQSALFMAEAWGKLTRRAGVAMVTAGPGFTNALTGVASAHFSNTPLVLIAGCVGLDNKEKLDLQDMPQEAVIKPMVKKTLVCQKPERINEYIDLAFRTAQSGRPGPVYLEFPIDVLNTPVQKDAVKYTNTEVVSNPADPAKASEMIKMMQKAENPVVIAGTGAWQSHAESELKEFIEKTGMPLFTSLSGRGVVSDDHPLCFEGAIAIRPGCGFAAYIETDLIIVLGSRICLYYLFGDIFNPAAKLIQVDIEPEEIGRNRTVDLPVVSDVKGFLNACNQLLKDELSSELKLKFTPWIEKLSLAHKESKKNSKNDWQSDNLPIHPLRLAGEINAFMNQKTDIVVADGGDTTTWMGMTRTMTHAGRYLDYGIYGSLAVGLPYANAAKLLNPDSRVCLITGDGSIGFNFMEFETAIRKNLPIVVVISNDLGWGMIRHSQELRIGHAIENGTFIGKVDYHKMVEAIGGRGFFVQNPQDIKPALEEAFASNKVCCINVMTDPTTVSPGSAMLANVGAYKA
ncbi:MAG: thiamine pyrophosphate-binding protein [Desulfobacula sp.]|jgi:acetolactate synthase-1/2/3 large subunit|uniref:thiamine pyrophosphate-binding protein n=1 Tax=Desulfobacula sp. TaxID=2593537 RepID=UPI001D281D91|nr:thiamine pyrophosphate-binding protein [Desulfobacula sp.]MBT3486141.1 thiamine pyrophosphate-binding protein [Desulfobacula sp.]MBT3805671.1 thiamine pyrophosphate-binding protein [Desulfobacula sp.]MBT4024891.1 thiamine pyrophosphate-binding protein [Desulfobacula sp.]MBT4198781.1 thiamine pyrophosphate-binding protein [Desulfobacula sp.]